MAVATLNGLTVQNPVSGEVIGTVASTSRDDVRRVAAQARDAQKTWGTLPISERARILRRFSDLLWADQENTSRIIRSETGKVDASAFSETIVIDAHANYLIHNAARILQPEQRRPYLPLVERTAVLHKPYGVVGIISPWNYPVMLTFVDVLPALVAGNAVIIKPSELTPYSVLHVVGLLHQAGVPAHVLQVVTGGGETGEALIDQVDYVNFTGSTKVGRKVAVQCAERFIPYTLELGGKAPMIVLQDANLDLAVTQMLKAGFENAGQACTAVERVYVEAPIYDRFVACTSKYAQQLVIGNEAGYDVHVGSVISERELRRVEDQVADALERGARLLYGGKRRPDLGPLFYEPAILVDTDHTMRVMREETFGPILPIMRVENVEEAVELANDSEFALSAYVFTADLKRGEQIAARLNTGDVGINRANFIHATTHLPWGGAKNSGIGRRSGPEGLLRFTQTQSLIVDTQLGMVASLSLADPLTMTTVKTLRLVRRYLPFV
ncbi:MAG: succinic semialdehyde dehydrogenase [Anaerolineae bacterium]